jgi:hypothetical protein
VSIQQAAVKIMHHYYAGDFGVYNQFLERIPTSATSRMRIGKGGSSVASGETGTCACKMIGDISAAGFKMYSIDGGAEHLPADVNTQAALMIAAARKRESSHNER